MKRLLLGLVAIGWLGCGAAAPTDVESAPPPATSHATAAAAAAPSLQHKDGVAAPKWVECDFDPCIPSEECEESGGSYMGPACGPGRVCCALQ